ncbi:MAG: Thermostable carboxypeptidase 1 [Chlamydiales bacterium]|nr:Thermostable carboxypeptidase 1 [Chlamydiales bacterium]MCH9620415.1 Thermostable carboxypeptidase 1 [Chlamydiales bacterium]MCH9622939.1 Thermostable carboxypeptidase 1 [Chlamydiales bacterium]
MKSYQELFAQSKKIKLLESVSSLLGWDQETYMPKKATSNRAEQIALMTSLSHQERTSPTYKKLLSKLIDLESGEILVEGLKREQKAALKRWLFDYQKAAALPNEFVTTFAKLSSESMMVWQEARKNNSFKTFAPYLTKVLEMSRQKADYFGYATHPYNALVDLFEPEMTVEQIDPLFAQLKETLSPFLKEILKKDPVDHHFLSGNFSPEKQMEFGNFILKKIGYDLEAGRLDLSAHPMSIAMHPHDSRITTRTHSDALFDCISAVLHEAGHGFYEMGLDPKHYGSPLCESISLGIHESQSRLWETRIGQSKPFWKHFLPSLKKRFKTELDSVTLPQFYRAINHVSPSFIRVESDEVTYSLHVILRYELEKELLTGKLTIKDLPEAWNHRMKTLFGITPKNDTEGCLQDVHWSMGCIGYFPTYALGNLYAAQFFNTFEEEHPDWGSQIEKGEFSFLKEWLKKNIHQHGRGYTATELVKKVTKKPLSTTPYLNYLKSKYEKIYKI